jgi:hypothetical protein
MHAINKKNYAHWIIKNYAENYAHCIGNQREEKELSNLTFN